MILLGTSLGSAIAVHFAREHPECVRAMVMSGPQVYVVSAMCFAGFARLPIILLFQSDLSQQRVSVAVDKIRCHCCRME